MEIDKRLFNKEWRMQNLYVIRDKEANLVRFRPNKMQQQFEKDRHTRNIILKSRQLGMTTKALIDSLDTTLFGRNTDAIVVFQDQNVSRKKFREVVMLAFNMIPADLRGQLWKVVNDKAEQLTVDFGSGETSTIITAISGRGSTPNRVHISEYAKICAEAPEKADEIRKGLIAAIPMTGRVDIESTAEGVAGDFHDTFWDAWERGEPKNPLQFKAHFYNWQYDTVQIAKTPLIDIPFEYEALFRAYQKDHKLTDKELAWYFMMWENVAGKDWSTMKEQYPTTPEEAFEVAGDKYFEKSSVDKLKAMTDDYIGDDGWKIFEPPDKKGVYAIGADVAEGVGRDASAAVVLRFDSKATKVVATYANEHIEPGDYATVLENMGNKYNGALIAVERNNHGHSVIQRLKDDYWNLYKEERFDKQTNQRTDRIGWLTTMKTKIDMLNTMRSALLEGELEVPSKELQYELRMFPREYASKKSTDKTITKHFDMLIALCICYKMLSVVYSKETKTITTSVGVGGVLGGETLVSEDIIGKPMAIMDETEKEWARQLDRESRTSSDNYFDLL